MRVKHRFAFRDDNADAIHLLDKFKIKYDKEHNIVAFNIFESDDAFVTIERLLKSHNITSIPTAVYTRDEIEYAQWLVIRSGWNILYPQPEEDMGYRFTTYDATNYCAGDEPKYFCRKGLVQKEGFVLKKEPNWGARNFLAIHWVSDELFVSPKAAEVLRRSGLKGFDFYDVSSKSKKVFAGIKQLFINNYVGEGFSADAIQRKYVCPMCGFTKYWPKPGCFRFHKKIFEGVQDDIIKTTDKFWEIQCDSLIFISQRFYQVINNAKLDRGLAFEPVVLI